MILDFISSLRMITEEYQVTRRYIDVWPPCNSFVFGRGGFDVFHRPSVGGQKFLRHLVNPLCFWNRFLVVILP